MEKEYKIGCIIGIGIIIGFMSIFIAIIAISKGMFVDEPKETIQTYEVTYINGLKEIVSYKVHEGTKAFIESSMGSYYLSLYYENTNLFGFKYIKSDGCVAGVVSCKRVK